MIKDIFELFPEQVKTIGTGLFSEKRSEFTKISEGVRKYRKTRRTEKYTRYGDLAKYTVNPSCNLLDMLFGGCDDFAHVFVENNPQWRIGAAIREANYVSLIHVYAYRMENGRYLFADVRGISDDPGEFFSEFSLSKNSLRICDKERPFAKMRYFENKGLDYARYDYWKEAAEDLQDAKEAYLLAKSLGFYKRS